MGDLVQLTHSHGGTLVLASTNPEAGWIVFSQGACQPSELSGRVQTAPWGSDAALLCRVPATGMVPFHDLGGREARVMLLPWPLAVP
jgi:hypothetical protein